MRKLMSFMLVFGLISISVQAHTVNAPVKNAGSKVTNVTVYQQSAIVTREVDVPEGMGAMELVVTPLPPQTVHSSLYSEGTNGVRVLTTRYRTRPVKEDARAEVRKIEQQIRDLQLAAQKMQSDIKTIEQNLQMLAKLEAFTATTMQHLSDKGMLSSDSTINLAKYIMDTRTARAKELVDLQQQVAANNEQTQFAQRQLQEVAAKSSRTEHDAVITIDKKTAPAGKLRLSYLVSAASWRPQYKFRAGKEKEPVQVEYLAAVTQQTGEDWSNVAVVLSTAQPMLNAAPPELTMLEVNITPRVPGGKAPGVAGQFPGGAQNFMIERPLDEVMKQTRELRQQAQSEFNINRKDNWDRGNSLSNSAAAIGQCNDLFNPNAISGQKVCPDGVALEGPSVTYQLRGQMGIPSRSDEQVIEVARLEMTGDWFYKAVPILTPHVYRQAALVNKSDNVLLPGEATMYIGTDFVGRTNLPLVAVGEKFTAGFGADPQLQVTRQLIAKDKTTQGGNQVLRYDYRVRVSSYKSEPVQVQLWDRLPHAEAQAAAVTLVSQKPEISKDSDYQREDRPKNLLRWDLVVEPKMTGDKALAVEYQFKIELDRQMQIGTLTAK